MQKRETVSEVLHGEPTTPSGLARLRWGVLVLSGLLCVVQVFLTVFEVDVLWVSFQGFLGPFGFAILLIFVLAINPLLRLIRFIRPMNRAELMAVLMALAVTMGICEHGLTATLLPLVMAPHNPNWNTPQRGWADHVIPQLNRKLYVEDKDEIAKFNEGWGPITVIKDGEPANLMKPLPLNPVTQRSGTVNWSQRIEYWMALWSRIPWSTWAKPLAYWMIFVVGCYGIFYCLSLTVLSYWSNREKLIFPHVKLAESLLPEEDQPRRWIPASLRAGLFWWGFGISFTCLAWQAPVNAGWTGSLTGLGYPAGLHPAHLKPIITGTIFEGLGGPGNHYGLNATWTFAAVGIAFLVPLNVSFSMWSYYVAAKCLMLIAVWLGFGQTMSDFPTDYLWKNNPISAQGGGALFLFSGVCLYRAVRDYLQLAAGRPWRQRVRIMASPIGLAGFMLVVVLWLGWNQLPLIWSFALVGVVTLLSLGLMRLVAEAGIYTFFLHTGFFHLYKVFGLGKFLSPMVAAAMLPICSVFFMHWGAFIAPSFLNSAKARQETAASPARFHLNVIGAVTITVVLALGFTLFLAYLRGAQSKHPYFYNRVPQLILDETTELATSSPDPERSNAFWYAFGAGWTGLSMLLRRTLFWFPHPIGYIMLANTSVNQLWLSFFFAWICKKITVKYGGKATFDRVRLLFIGFVIGELVAYTAIHIVGASIQTRFGIQ